MRKAAHMALFPTKPLEVIAEQLHHPVIAASIIADDSQNLFGRTQWQT